MKKHLTIIFFVCAFSFALNAQKLQPEEIVAKNLDAIASPAIRAKLKNITVVADVTYAQGLNDKNTYNGRGVIVSEDSKLALAMSFPIQIYPVEKLSNDGKNLKVGFISPGTRSTLGQYLWAYEEIIKDGLFGGVLSKSWSFYDLSGRKGKITAEGTKKLDGKEVYVFAYSPRKGSDLDIRLYFDQETFRHVRTEYRRLISARMGPTPELSARQTETRQDMTEDFADFKTEQGITLPRSYKIRLFIEQGRTREYSYNFLLKDFYYNQPLEAATFDISVN